MNLDSPVSSIMTNNVVSVSSTQKLVDVKHIFEKQNFHHHIPVVDNGTLTGMISLIDFIHAIGNAGLEDSEKVYNETVVKEIMKTEPETVNIGASIREVSQILSKGEFHALPVVEGKSLKGIVTTADIIKWVLKNS